MCSDDGIFRFADCIYLWEPAPSAAPPDWTKRVNDDLHTLITEQIPHLRRYARALLRDVTGADDLVQDCLTRAVDRLHL